jgi:hypothetical protein
MLSQAVISFALVALVTTSLAAPVQTQADGLMDTGESIVEPNTGFSPRNAIIDMDDDLSRRQLAQVDA